jgi:hypothetical protein
VRLVERKLHAVLSSKGARRPCDGLETVDLVHAVIVDDDVVALGSRDSRKCQ